MLRRSLVLLVLVLSLVLLGCNQEQRSEEKPKISPSKIPATQEETSIAETRRSVGAEFELKGKTVDGNDFNWNDYAGKVVLIDFWASWCGPCIAEVPNMIEAYEKYKDKGFEIVGIGVWDETEKLKEAQKNKKMTWVSLDEGQTEQTGSPKLSEYYGVRGVPTMFVVGRDGKIAEINTRGKGLMDFLQKELGE